MLGPTLPIWERNAPASPARPEPKAKVSMLTRSVRTPMHEAIPRFCMTALNQQAERRFGQQQPRPKYTIMIAKPITNTRL